MVLACARKRWYIIETIRPSIRFWELHMFSVPETREWRSSLSFWNCSNAAVIATGMGLQNLWSSFWATARVRDLGVDFRWLILLIPPLSVAGEMQPALVPFNARGITIQITCLLSVVMIEVLNCTQFFETLGMCWKSTSVPNPQWVDHSIKTGRLCLARPLGLAVCTCTTHKPKLSVKAQTWIVSWFRFIHQVVPDSDFFFWCKPCTISHSVYNDEPGRFSLDGMQTSAWLDLHQCKWHCHHDIIAQCMSELPHPTCRDVVLILESTETWL